jgi:hypothetical protein
VRAGERWQARRFAGTAWQRDTAEEHFVRNTYRVLMTRARYETVLYIPAGDAADATRDPATFDAIADFLTRCGAEATAAEAWPTPPEGHQSQNFLFRNSTNQA